MPAVGTPFPNSTCRGYLHHSFPSPYPQEPHKRPGNEPLLPKMVVTEKYSIYITKEQAESATSAQRASKRAWVKRS